jgi:hypothetical protein
MVVEQVKEEATGERPSALSGWYRAKLGRDVAISDIDWLITSISNKDTKTRYLIIEEKTVSNSDRLLIGLGQARSLKEVKQDIVRENVPLFVIFIKNKDVSLGVWLYEFDSQHINDSTNWCKIGKSWYVDVKKYSKFYKEEELIPKLLKTIRASLK